MSNLHLTSSVTSWARTRKWLPNEKVNIFILDLQESQLRPHTPSLSLPHALAHAYLYHRAWCSAPWEVHHFCYSVSCCKDERTEILWRWGGQKRLRRYGGRHSRATPHFWSDQLPEVWAILLLTRLLFPPPPTSPTVFSPFCSFAQTPRLFAWPGWWEAEVVVELGCGRKFGATWSDGWVVSFCAQVRGSRFCWIIDSPHSSSPLDEGTRCGLSGCQSQDLSEPRREYI